MNSNLFFSSALKVLRTSTRALRLNPINLHEKVIDPPETLELAEDNYRRRYNEDIEIKKARLMYQSRKRGMLENDILLSTFAEKYLSQMNEKQIDEYDKIINLPSNDWDLYNWAVGAKPTPVEFDNSVMNLLKEHTKNTKKEKRYRMPDIK